MKSFLKLSEFRALLQRGINSGHWTLEELDFPSPDYERNLIPEVDLENATDRIVSILGTNKVAELVAALTQRLNIE